MTTPSEMTRDIRVSKKDLPKTWPECQRALESRQRNERDRRIYLGYLGAEDKEAYLIEMASKWGYEKKPGCVRTIIDKFVSGKKHLSAEFAVQADAIGNIKKAQIWEDGEARRAELNAQITYFEELREAGTNWVDQEETDITGEKPSIKTKRVSVNTIIRSLRAELHNTHTDDATAMRPYEKKHIEPVELFSIRAHPELIARLEKLNSVVKTEIIDE